MTQAGATFVDDLRLSLRKRQKAIKHKVQALETERLLDRSNDGHLSGLSIECALWAPRAAIRLSAWEDRWIWFDARQGGKQGWRWAYTHEGRMFGEDTGRRLVAALEASFHAAFVAGESGRLAFAEIWEPLLAQGPKEAPLV